MRLIVTRPSAQAAPWVAALQAMGLEAQALPLIDIAPAPDLAPVQAAWRALDALALVMFVSANAVEHFFAARPAGAKWPAALLAGSTGPGTSAALRAAGVQHIEEPAADAPQFDTEALWARLTTRHWQGERVLVVRGEDGAREAEHRIPVVGQPYLAGVAENQVSAGRRFELADVLAHRWLAQPEQLPGGGKVQRFGHCDEGA